MIGGPLGVHIPASSAPVSFSGDFVSPSRLEYFEFHRAQTIFNFVDDAVVSSGYDIVDIVLVIHLLGNTLRTFGIKPESDDATIMNTLKNYFSPVDAPKSYFPSDRSRDVLPFRERFMGATFDYHELCIKVFGEDIAAIDTRQASEHRRAALWCYTFLLRLLDCATKLDELAKAQATAKKTAAILDSQPLARLFATPTPPSCAIAAE